LINHAAHYGELIAGSVVLKTSEDGEADSADHHANTTYAHYLISNGALSQPPKVFHVFIAILLLAGSFVCCGYFILALLFSDRGPFGFGLELVLALLGAITSMFLFVLML
jgi:hypothetical protein